MVLEYYKLQRLQSDKKSLLHPRISRTLSPVQLLHVFAHARGERKLISIAGIAMHSMEDHGSSASSTHKYTKSYPGEPRSLHVSLKSNYGTNRL